MAKCFTVYTNFVVQKKPQYLTADGIQFVASYSKKNKKQMFKAKLIENEKYYKLRRNQLLLMLLPAVPAILIINYYQIPVWLVIILAGIYILATIWMDKNQKRINSMLGNKLIEIDEKAMRIKSKEGLELELIKLDEVEKIIVKDEYSLPQETMKEVGQEITGKTKENFIILHFKHQKRKLDFEIDSYFMVTQLNKLIESWKVKGYKIERITLSS